MSAARPQSVFVRLLEAYKRHGYLVRAGLNPYYWSDADAPFARLFTATGEPVGVGAGLAPQELHFLELLLEAGIRPKNALVIGNAFGWSTIALGLLLPQATVVAMEAGLEGLDTAVGVALTHAIASEEGLHVRVVEAWSPRDTATVVARDLGGAPLDLVLVDGLHVNEQVIRDVAGVWPHASPNCMVLLHDVLSWHMLDAFEHLPIAATHERRILTRTPSGLGLVFPRTIDAGVRDVIDAFCDETVGLTSMLQSCGATVERPGPLLEPRLAAGWKDRRMGMAATYAFEGRTDLERAQLEMQAVERTDEAEVHCRLGVWLADHGEWTSAAQSLRIAVSLGPARAFPLQQLGRVLRELGQIADAERCLQRAADLDPRWAAPEFELGLLAMGNGTPALAVAPFAKAVDLEPTWVEARASLGRAAHAAGDAQFVVEALRPIADSDQVSPDVVHILALATEQIFGVDGAMVLFKRAGELMPESAAAQFDLGRMLAATGETVEAMGRFFRAAELQPEWTDAWLSAGRVAEALGQYGDAERALSIVAVARPESAQDWYALAHVRARIGKGREAREACAHASVRDPACDAIKSVALRLMESGDMASAEAVLSDGIDRVPDWAGAHYLRGQALELLDRRVDAHTGYARASALRPSWREAAAAAARTADRVRTLSAIG